MATPGVAVTTIVLVDDPNPQPAMSRQRIKVGNSFLILEEKRRNVGRLLRLRLVPVSQPLSTKFLPLFCHCIRCRSVAPSPASPIYIGSGKPIHS